MSTHTDLIALERQIQLFEPPPPPPSVLEVVSSDLLRTIFYDYVLSLDDAIRAVDASIWIQIYTEIK